MDTGAATTRGGRHVTLLLPGFIRHSFMTEKKRRKSLMKSGLLQAAAERPQRAGQIPKIRAENQKNQSCSSGHDLSFRETITPNMKPRRLRNGFRLHPESVAAPENYCPLTVPMKPDRHGAGRLFNDLEEKLHVQTRGWCTK